jgi:hypothetical protein
LDNLVRDFLPAEIRVPNFEGSNISLRHLDTHHSGLPYDANPSDSTNHNGPVFAITVFSKQQTEDFSVIPYRWAFNSNQAVTASSTSLENYVKNHPDKITK